MSDNLPGNEPNSNPVPPPGASTPPPAAPAAPPAGSAANMPPAPTAPPAPAYSAGPVQPKGLAIAALVLGILSLIFVWVPIAGFIGGVVALILGILALRKGQHKGMSLTGIITGALAAIIGLVVSILFFVGLSMLGGTLDDAQQAVKDCQAGASTVEVAGQTVSCDDLSY
ncbi:DUF4190 domain-containing protein [Leucobacter sp. USHLN153]|uniref:DUF4190 domain-containing protein n=1 Tax=Leucobacter sp. USHLN153 TaxID=3081268 RepID=UPI00301635D4